MSSRPAPRPILKRSPGLHPNDYPPEHGAHVVHFPPTINIARTFDTHSSTMYDRSPIAVSPNSCALPERGCPGRTYHSSDEPSSPGYFPGLNTQPGSRGHAHPRAFCRPQPESMAMPPLVPDLSSESDESDGFSHFPATFQPNSFRHHPSPPRYPNSTSVYDTRPVYAPSNPAYPSHMNTPYITAPSYPQYPMDVSPQKPRRRQDTHCEKQWDYRIRSSGGGNVEADDPGYDDDADIATPISSSPPERKKRSHRKSSSSVSPLCKTFSGFGVQDDVNDCLEGF